FVVARFRDTYLKEIRETEHGARSSETAARVTPDTHARSIDIIKTLSQLTDTANLVGKGILRHIAVAHIVEALRTQRVAGTFNQYHYKAQFGQRLVVAA